MLLNVEKSFTGLGACFQVIQDPVKLIIHHWVIHNEQNCIRLTLLEADKSQVKGLAFDKGLLLHHLMTKARGQGSVKARGAHPVLFL